MKLKKTKLALMALLMASSIGLSACGQKEEPKKEATQTEEKKEDSKVQLMKGDELAKIESDKKEKENYLVIDVRSPEEYKEGHLKFAINMPIDDFDKEMSSIDGFKDKNVVVYCNSGKKSAEVAEKLVKAGFTKVYDAEGVKKHDYDLVKFSNELGPEFDKDIKDGKAKLIIDARKTDDFKKGTFDKAINIMPDDFDAKKGELPKDKNEAIYVFCYTGNKSAEVAQKLIDDGYTNVVNAIDGSKEYDYGF